MADRSFQLSHGAAVFLRSIRACRQRGGILDNLYLILATRLLLGVTVAGALIAALTGIGTLPPRQRAQMFGFQSVAGAMLAIGCFPLVGAFAAIGWRWPFALHLVGDRKNTRLNSSH